MLDGIANGVHVLPEGHREWPDAASVRQDGAAGWLEPRVSGVRASQPKSGRPSITYCPLVTQYCGGGASEANADLPGAPGEAPWCRMLVEGCALAHDDEKVDVVLVVGETGQPSLRPDT